jgi:hypothetical protein
MYPTGCEYRSCNKAHLISTCSALAKGNSCELWGKGDKTHVKNHAHESGCDAEEWTERIAIARLRLAHITGRFGVAVESEMESLLGG